MDGRGEGQEVLADRRDAHSFSVLTLGTDAPSAEAAPASFPEAWAPLASDCAELAMSAFASAETRGGVLVMLSWPSLAATGGAG